MATLKNPQGQLPGGYQFYVPDTKWTPQPFSSLDSITQQLIQHRLGRPDLIAKNGWSTDPAVVRREVEDYNVQVAIRNGWNDYLIGGSEGHVPFQPPPRPTILQRLGNVVAGSGTMLRWKKDGHETVPQEQANKRAETCSKCPQNGKGGWETWFTVPVSNAIRHEIEQKKEIKLETPFDEKLGTCGACTCPLPLMVWTPLEVKTSGMSADQWSKLDSGCWVFSEQRELTQTQQDGIVNS